MATEPHWQPAPSYLHWPEAGAAIVVAAADIAKRAQCCSTEAACFRPA